MKTYVVRIYRFEDENPFSLTGGVEEVGVEGRKSFTNYEELWRILKAPPFPFSFNHPGEDEDREFMK